MKERGKEKGHAWFRRGVSGFLALVLTVSLVTSVIAGAPVQVHAEDVFAEILTDGKLVMKAAPPDSPESAYATFELLYDEYEGRYWLDTSTLNSTYTKGTLTYREEGVTVASKEVEIVYEYDETVKNAIDGIAAMLPRPEGNEPILYPLTDMEYVNYLLCGMSDTNMMDFSGALKIKISNKNFHIDVRGGDSHLFYTEMMGIPKFIYDDTLYYSGDFGMGVYAQHVIYVNDDTTDIPAAVKERVSTVFGDVNITITDGIPLDDFYDAETNSYIDIYNEMKADYDQHGWNAETVEAYAVYGAEAAAKYAEDKLNQLYYNEDAPYHFLREAEDEFYEMIAGDVGFYFVVIKDSSKVNNNISFLTSDVRTDISIATTANSSIPLDTMIKVDQLTSGDTYNKITSALASKNIASSETYDLTLHSNSLEQNITNVSNGEFTVRIPISDALKDKDLTVYFVDGSGTVTEYPVTVSDGNAVFNTNHFSIYTLAAYEKEAATTAASTAAPTSPKTGDAAPIAAAGSLLVVALTMILFLEGKKIRR